MKLIPDELFIAICEYLATRPYREVVVALNALQKCPSIDTPKKGPQTRQTEQSEVSTQ